MASHKFVEDEEKNQQVYAINSMMQRGLTDIEIALLLNQSGEQGGVPKEGGWTPKDVRELAAACKLPVYFTPGRRMVKYKLKADMDFGDMIGPALIWVILIVLTAGIAVPLFFYYLGRFLINHTEIEEITY